MASQADFDEYVEAQRSIRALARRDVAVWWASVQHLPASEIQAAALDFIPLVARTYGEVAATAAADYYEMARADSVARGRFSATLAQSAAAAGARREVRWAMAPAFSGEPVGALDRLSGVVDKWALQDGKRTMIHNAERDPARPRWARIPVGKTCAWCLMLASRGAVYRSASTAGDAKDFHTNDDCSVHPSWDHGRDLPESYDEAALYGIYERARRQAGKNPSTQQITAQIRRLDGGKYVTDGVGPRTP